MSTSPPARRGALIFFGLILVCLGFALLLLREPSGPDDKGPRVGVIEIEGLLSGSRRTLAALRAFRKDDTIKAIVVRLNTPGGPVGPAQEIYREIERTRQKKPVVASMATVAASGGYYVAAACEKIVANAGTLTGSIGVITQTTEVSKLLSLARIETHTMKSGPFKDSGSPLRAMTDSDRQQLQGMVDRIYAQFVRDVAKGRKLDEAAVRKVADGRVLTGEDAHAHKLVDVLGNFSDALELAAKLAKAEGEPVPVYRRRSRGLLGQLIDEATASVRRSVEQQLTGSLRLETRHPLLRAP